MHPIVPPPPGRFQPHRTYLRKIKSPDDLDLIIALGMAMHQ